MAGNVGELNDGLVTLLDAIQGETMAAAKIRFCVIGFDHSVRCYLEPSDLREVETMPELDAYGGTSYTVAFGELHRRIPDDVARLKAEGYEVRRPAVFFLSDGEPNHGDGWEEPHSDLTDGCGRISWPSGSAMLIGKLSNRLRLRLSTHL